MNAHTPLPADSDSPSDWERALLDRQMGRLDRLADMGLAIAGAIERRVMAAEADAAPDTILHHAALDFARVSRAVRMTLALQSRLVQDFKAPARSAGAAAAGAETYFVRWLGEDAAQKSKVQGAVRRIAEDRGLDAETVERLIVEAGERLERDDIYGLLDRPIHEIVAEICRDLGLDPSLGHVTEMPLAGTPVEGRQPAARSAIPIRHEGHEAHQEEHEVLRDLPS